MMGFDHEPGALVGTSPSDSGSQADYRAAWEHVVEVFTRAGVTNVSWVWTLTADEFANGDPQSLYPGSHIVDWVGVDGYTNITCPWLNVGWREWDTIFSAAHDFADDVSKPLVVAEFGLREDPTDPSRKGQWLTESLGSMQAMDRLKAVVSFNSEADCSSYLLSSGAAVDAVAGWVDSGWFVDPPAMDGSG